MRLPCGSGSALTTDSSIALFRSVSTDDVPKTAAAFSLRLDPLTIALTALAGFVALLALLALYLTQRERLEALARASILDPLTGLVGGRYLDAELWPTRVRSASPLAVLYVGMGRLKRRNDGFGHAAGERLIVRAAEVLLGCVRRGSDDVARLHSAGDEFLIALSCPSVERAERIAATVLERLRAASISASIGVAFTDRAEHGLRAALRGQAEAAMYAARRDSGGRYVVAEAETATPADAMQRLASSASDRDAVPVWIDETADPPRTYTEGAAVRLARSGQGV